MSDGTKFGAAVVATLALIVGLFLGGAWVFGMSKADGGHVIVVRNGGMFDDNSIQQVIQPNSGLTPTGLWSTDHEYPTSQRFYKVSADGSGDSNEQINVPSKDGILLGIEGTFYFQLNTNPDVLKAFDDRYGTRTYGPNDNRKFPYEGDEGWQNFLNATMGNSVQNVLRQEVGNVKCQELYPSCVLIQNQSAIVVDGEANETLAQIQTKVQTAFQKDIAATLGVPVFENITFVLSKVTPPAEVQAAITKAQSAFAGVSESNAALEKAKVEKQTNEVRQQGYNACSVCGEIDKINALPDGLTTYVAPGADAAVAVGGK